jgi:hypothetical protein
MAVIKKATIGDLRNVGHFESNTHRQAYTAGYVDGYSNVVASVYCKLWQGASKRINDFGKIEVVSFWNMQCRFQEAIDANVIVSTKFVQGNRKFTIIGMSVIDERNYQYHFTLNLVTL